MMPKNKIRLISLLQRNDGSAIIEYAIVAPVFFLLFFGIIEFGLFMFTKMAIERISVDVARVASLGKVSNSGSCPESTDNTVNHQIAYIKCIIKEKAKGIINGNRIEVQVQTLASGGTSVPDLCLDDPKNPSSTVATCNVYQDVNGNGHYDSLGSSNPGQNSSLMEVLITYPWTVQFPLVGKYFNTMDVNGNNHEGVILVTSSTIIKNEP